MTPSPINEYDDEVIGGLIGGTGGDPLEYSLYEEFASAEMLSSAKNRLWMTSYLTYDDSMLTDSNWSGKEGKVPSVAIMNPKVSYKLAHALNRERRASPWITYCSERVILLVNNCYVRVVNSQLHL